MAIASLERLSDGTAPMPRPVAERPELPPTERFSGAVALHVVRSEVDHTLIDRAERPDAERTQPVARLAIVETVR